MKKLFYIIFTVIIILNFNSNIIKAQETENPSAQKYPVEVQAHGITRWMTNYLNLDKAQSIEFNAIYLKYLKQTDTVRVTTNATIDKKESLLQISNNKQTELQTILTPEQYTKYSALYENAEKKPLKK